MKQVRTIGRTFNAEIEVYSENKYTADAQVFENSRKILYTNVEHWEIISGEDAAEIEAKGGILDDNHEYLVLHFTDGGSATFRNSYVDMWRR